MWTITAISCITEKNCGPQILRRFVDCHRKSQRRRPSLFYYRNGVSALEAMTKKIISLMMTNRRSNFVLRTEYEHLNTFPKKTFMTFVVWLQFPPSLVTSNDWRWFTRWVTSLLYKFLSYDFILSVWWNSHLNLYLCKHLSLSVRHAIRLSVSPSICSSVV